jgi:RNA polymerase sigma factor (sigma-70 family)
MEAVRETGAEKTPTLEYPLLPDRELIDLICAGSQEATVEFLVNRYGRLLQYLARRYDDDLLSDIYHQIFSGGTWARLRKWDGRSKFGTWLGAVAHNLHAEKMRSRGRELVNLGKFASSARRLHEEDRVERDQPIVPITDREDGDARRSWILRALNSLSPRDQLLVSLLDLRDPPEKIEIVAGMMNRTVEVVRVAHTRAKKRLREALERDGGEDHE